MQIACIPLDDYGQEGVRQLLYVERYAWLSLSVDMAAVISLDGMFEDVNTHWEEHVGFSRDELQAAYLVEFIHFDDRERALADLQKLVTSDIGSTNLSFRFLCKDGRHRRVGMNVVFSPVHESFFCIAHGLEENEKSDPAALAYRDVLTGLRNRLCLEENLPRILAQARNQDAQAAVIFIDLDGFKEINDTFGHSTGDSLLVRVGARMSECLGDLGQLYRLGGDEFIVIVPLCDGRAQVSALAGRLLACLCRPFRLSKRTLTIGASLGVALSPKDGHDARELLELADQAMYHAKRSGKSAVAFASDVPGLPN